MLNQRIEKQVTDTGIADAHECFVVNRTRALNNEHYGEIMLVSSSLITIITIERGVNLIKLLISGLDCMNLLERTSK